MSVSLIVAFLAVTLLAYVTPGPDWFVVLPRAASGWRCGAHAALGVQSGLLVHMGGAAVGVSALLLTSATAFTIVKLAGAVYLAYLGATALIRALLGVRRDPPTSSTDSATSPCTVYRQAFLANVLNPKAALFFVAVLPQFLDPTLPLAPQVLLLGTIDILMGLIWWAIFIGAVARFSRLLTSRRGRTLVDAGSGIALTGLAAGLALANPPTAAH